MNLVDWMICDFYPTCFLPLQIFFLSETNIKDALKAISEIYCGRLASYEQINFLKHVCVETLKKMIVCLHCHEPVMSWLELLRKLSSEK